MFSSSDKMHNKTGYWIKGKFRGCTQILEFELSLRPGKDRGKWVNRTLVDC
jgi:hypothetical protein